jgi:hypothetical protein
VESNNGELIEVENEMMFTIGFGRSDGGKGRCGSKDTNFQSDKKNKVVINCTEW